MELWQHALGSSTALIRAPTSTAAVLEDLGEDRGDKEPCAPAQVTPTRRLKRRAVVRGGRAASTARRSNNDNDNLTNSAGKLVSSDKDGGQLCPRTRAERQS